MSQVTRVYRARTELSVPGGDPRSSYTVVVLEQRGSKMVLCRSLGQALEVVDKEMHFSAALPKKIEIREDGLPLVYWTLGVGSGNRWRRTMVRR